MQSAKLSGALLIWKGSPLAFAQPAADDAGPRPENPPAGGAAAERPARENRLPRPTIRLFLATAAAIAVCGAIGLRLRPAGETAAVTPVASVPVPLATVKLAPDAVHSGLPPPPIEPVAIALPPGGTGSHPKPASHEPPIRAAAHAAAKIASTGPAMAPGGVSSTSALQTAKNPPPGEAPKQPAAPPPAATVTRPPAAVPTATVTRPPAAVPATTATRPPAAVPAVVADRAEWHARGDVLFAAGALDPARQFYQLAAEAGDGQAALQLGETYDPAFLAQVHIAGGRGNPAAAAHWYQQAGKLGAAGAQVLLQAVMASAPAASSR